ncbi:hypothetical protein CVT26_013398 [Gymnopilus dilepis]|uniref:Ubiquitin-like protease family profile domain-containing protein n=1 Tax=Gymnopilus dilepis TaxID=231916 RepID=A0A409VV51_9AGAR|nr:hypothetical protein CVT26_013398 [Gymnopilus dilepis]
MVVSRERGKQPAIRSGLGNNFQSPKKKRSSYFRTSRTAWKILNPESEKQKLMAQMAEMYAEKVVDSADSRCIPSTYGNHVEYVPPEDQGVMWEGDVEDIDSDVEIPSRPIAPSVANGSLRRIIPDQSERNLYSTWNSLLPTLVDDILSYTSATVGLPGRVADSTLSSNCRAVAQECGTKSTKVLCLYLNHFKFVLVKSCDCQTIAQVLVRNGLFPTAPSQARMAISIDLLDFYTALFERSCDGVNAMAAALNSHYSRRGFYLVDAKGEKYREPFRKGFGYASQWLDKLREIVSKRVDDALQFADDIVQKAKKGGEIPRRDCEVPKLERHGPGKREDPLLTECSRNLRLLCPACFGTTSFGKSLSEYVSTSFLSNFKLNIGRGGDFLICTDGNFHHRHLTSAGAGIPFHQPKHFIPKKFVDEVGEGIKLARGRPRRATKSVVPDDAIDECENAHKAANGDKKPNSGNARYDDQGYMSLICRHDIPLFFANIDTPGEQQKYAISLIKWFFQFIPSNATVSVLYDVGCVLDRSIQVFGLLPETIVTRIQLVTTAMHAYGHQWACQLVYNPRLCRGLGLTDGEGVERVWSRLTKLIPIAARRFWLTDRQLSFIASESLESLGDWIKRRYTAATSKQERAEQALLDIGRTTAELQEQWELQKKSQLSLPPRCTSEKSKELDAFLSLQGQWDGVESAINAAKKALKMSTCSGKSLDLLNEFQECHERFAGNLDGLYVALNSRDSPPKLKGVCSEFCKTLRLARDLKISIRRRAIGSFFEWDRLDQAVGGRNLALGTKLHQQTRRSIARRQPALMSAIRKYNAHCTTLERLYNPACNIPLPQPLPTKLSELRDNSTLMEDVWTTASDKSPLWLEDADVKSGIHAMLRKERSLEEKRRLKDEAENLLTWLTRELQAVELALRQTSNALINVPLTRHRDRMLQLSSRWVNPIAPTSRFESLATDAQKLASELTGGSASLETRRQWANGADFDQELWTETKGKKMLYFSDNILKDLRLSKDSIDEQNDEQNDESTESLIVVSEILATTDDCGSVSQPEDTSTVQNTRMVTLLWEKPQGVLADDFRIDSKHLPPPSGSLTKSRVLGPSFFLPQDLQRLSQMGSMLNDVCLNGCAAVLKYYLDNDPILAPGSRRCALFTSHDLVRARYKARDKELWRIMSASQYWTKDVWILPIHRPRQLHWVLCVAYPRYGTVLLYDSLVGQQLWSNDLKDVSNLFTRLVSLANQFGHTTNLPTSGWVAQPVIVSGIAVPHRQLTEEGSLKTTPTQSNGHDCGLWVVAWIFATLRGFGNCNEHWTEETMPQWRAFLTALVAGLPLHDARPGRVP